MNDFLPLSMAVALADRMPDFVPFMIRYAKLVNDSGQLIAVNTSKFEQYFEDFELMTHTDCISNSPKLFAKANLAALKDIKTISDTISEGKEYTDKPPEKVAQRLYLLIQLIRTAKRPNCDHAYDYRLDTSPYKQPAVQLVREQYRRYKDDEALFRADLKKYRTILKEDNQHVIG